MAVTRDFKELVQKRIARDPAFGDALLREGIDTMLAGDIDTGRRSCATTSRRRSASRSWARRPARRRKASSACWVRAAIRRRAISSASSVICKSRPASSCTSRRDRPETEPRVST